MLDTVASEKLVDVAERITISRVVFAQLYDPLVAPLVPEKALPFIALARLRERDEPGSAGGRKDVADFAEALRQAEGLGLLAEFLARHATQLFGGAAAADEVIDGLKAHPRYVETFNRSLPAVIGEIDALRRTCRIICQVSSDEQERGSGFLIGPHLVLTNYHVVKALIADGRAKPESYLQLRVELDALQRSDGRLESIKSFGVTNSWLVDFREAHPEELSGGWPGRPSELAEKLDFAILEIDGTPGYERGWYDLDEGSSPEPGQNFELFQFPLGRPMAHAPGTFALPEVFQFSEAPPRFHHDAETERGSSGGLCLDGKSKAIALHQGDQGQGPDGKERKVAIPLSLIAGVSRQKVVEKIANAPRIVTTTATGEPVLGRRRLQCTVDEMIRGPARALVVQSGADPETASGKLGKTFSKAILRALLPPAGHVVFEVAAQRLTGDAFEAARAILQAAGRGEPSSPAQPQSMARPFTPTDADELARTTIAGLLEAAGTSGPWLVIDDLDHFPVRTETTTATFLDAFYTRAVTGTELRIVLIGPPEIPPGLRGFEPRTDVLREHITDEDVEAWITRLFRQRTPLLPEQARILVAVIRSTGATAASDRTIGRTLATATDLARYWLPVLRAEAKGRS